MARAGPGRDRRRLRRMALRWRESRRATMPRYFFNIMEGRSQNLVRDIEGALLADAGQARKEALGLAQDITRHGIHEPPQAWAVIVTDEHGDEVASVPLAATRARKTPAALGHRVALPEWRLESVLSP